MKKNMQNQIEIVLSNESGVKIQGIEIGEVVLEKIKNKANQLNLKCLSFVDIYGDTTFNTLQMKEIITECSLLKKKFKDNDVLKAIESVTTLAKEGKDVIHSFLRFIGN